MWFFGWGCLLVHYAALLVAGDSHNALRDRLGAIVAVTSLQLCVLCFIFAASNARLTRINRILILELGLPVFLQSFLYLLDQRSYAAALAANVLFLVPAIHLLIMRQHRSRAFNHIATGFAVLALGLVPFTRANPYIILNVILCTLFLSAAYLTLMYATKMTRGNVLVVIGLALWGLSYILQADNWLGADVHLHHAILDLPRFVAGAGMILSLLDEYVGHTESLALHDPLTGLPNRRLFENRLDQAIEESMRTRMPIACLVIDVDNFKYINDNFGHPVGDGLLQALAKRLSWNLGPRDMLARTGGDEFTAVLVEAADEYHVRFIAGAMMAAGCVPVSIGQHAIDVCISIGIAVSPQDAANSSELNKAADEAMYRAKRRGGSSVAFASEETPQIHAV